MKRLICILLCCILLIPACALAEIKRGDTGTDVAALQLMLWDTGFLFDEPDGIFGKQTEQAVKNFQKYAGLPQTGVVGDSEQDALRACWLRAMEEQGAPAPEEEMEPQTARYALCCHRYMAVDGSEVIDLCERHAALDADDTLPARDKWLAEVETLYEAWAAAVPESSRSAITAAGAAFRQYYALQAQALALLQPEDAEERLVMLLRDQCAEVCNLLFLAGVS